MSYVTDVLMNLLGWNESNVRSRSLTENMVNASKEI
jgi:hypothetical protein